MRDQYDEVLDENFVEGRDFVYKRSSASTALSEISGIIYGGLSSRFWMLRKHLISTNVKHVQAGKAPFYSWQCLTL